MAEKNRQSIIVPLDTTDVGLAKNLVTQLSGSVYGFKIGYELGFSMGWDNACEMIKNHGCELMLDLKLDDIPNTVAGAARHFSQFAPGMMTIHASSGSDSIKAAVENSDSKTSVLAVTVLTSLAEQDAQKIFNGSTSSTVVRLSNLAIESGARGIVCSPADLRNIVPNLSEIPSDFAFVTPGVRPTWASSDDQARITTPAQAIEAGATHLVIGRPITKPPKGTSKDAVDLINEEISSLV